MSSVNIFSWYKQQEDDFTNGLIALLSLSNREESEIVTSFLRDILKISPAEPITTFRVLRGIDGTADAELSGPDCCLRFETKIWSGTLDKVQIDAHIERLRTRPEPCRKLVLLTPDDSRSQYIRRFVAMDPDHIIHVSWKDVCALLSDYVAPEKNSVLSELIRQYFERIRETVFEQDFAGVIVKIQFGPGSQVYEDKYLNEMKAEHWTSWNTPREYKSLDGTGRKLLLYHKGNGITAEVEIEKVERTDTEPGYPWSNVFVPGTLRIFDPPIPLSEIRSITGFENFGVHRKDRSPYRNITHERYRELMARQMPQ